MSFLNKCETRFASVLISEYKNELLFENKKGLEDSFVYSNENVSELKLETVFRSVEFAEVDYSINLRCRGEVIGFPQSASSTDSRSVKGFDFLDILSVRGWGANGIGTGDFIRRIQTKNRSKCDSGIHAYRW